MRSRTVSMPLSSEALSSNVKVRQFCPKSSRAMQRATVVFPVPGMPARSRCGIVFGLRMNALRLSTMSFRSTISLRFLGRYFSTHITASSSVAMSIPFLVKAHSNVFA